MNVKTHQSNILPEKCENQDPENNIPESQNSESAQSHQSQNSFEMDVKIADDFGEIPNHSGADSLQNDLQQLKEQLLIAQADFDNFRKRSVRDQEDIRRFACAALIEEILPILDNFEMGLKSVKVDDGTRSGFQMIFAQLQSLLFAKGLREITTANAPFNPLREEAVAYVDHETVPQEYVVETVRKGYLLHDRLLRPASVVVSKGKPPEENVHEPSEEK
jgi:molecular chaperone GrpE